MVLISFAGGNNLWTTFSLLLKLFFFNEKLQPGILSFTSPAIIILFIQPCLPVCSAATEALKRRDLLQRHLVLSDSPDLFFFFFFPKRSWGKRCVEDGVKEERVVYQRGRFPWLWCIIIPLLDVTRGKGQTWCLCGDFQPGPACRMASAVFHFFFSLSLAGALASVITRVIIISFFSRISPMADSLQELFYDQARQLSRSTHHLRCNVMCRCRPALFILEASVGGDIHVSAFFFSSAVTSTGPCCC